MGQFVTFYMPPCWCRGRCWATFMSVHDFNNEPLTGSTFLLRELLKNQWGFKGDLCIRLGDQWENDEPIVKKDEKEAAL